MRSCTQPLRGQPGPLCDLRPVGIRVRIRLSQGGTRGPTYIFREHCWVASRNAIKQRVEKVRSSTKERRLALSCGATVCLSSFPAFPRLPPPTISRQHNRFWTSGKGVAQAPADHSDVLAAGFGFQAAGSSMITVRTYDAPTGAILSEDSFDVNVKEEGAAEHDENKGRIFAGGIGTDSKGKSVFMLRVYDAETGQVSLGRAIEFAQSWRRRDDERPAPTIIPTRHIGVYKYRSPAPFHFPNPLLGPSRKSRYGRTCLAGSVCPRGSKAGTASKGVSFGGLLRQAGQRPHRTYF